MTPSRVLTLVLLAAAYYVAGRLGLQLAFLNDSASAVWPPTGIALSAMLRSGRWVWPGIAAGAFFVNVSTSGSLLASAGIAVGNTLEAVLGAHLAVRYARGVCAFERAPDFLRFVGGAGLLATMVSATIGVTSLLLTGLTDSTQYVRVWLTWWLGDAGGAIVVAPALILAFDRSPSARRQWWLEALLLMGVITLIVGALFGGWLPISRANYPLAFLLFPLLLWPAFRFGPRETAFSVVLVTGIAIWGTVAGYGPFGRADQNEALLLVQAFAGTTAITVLTMAALVKERRRLQRELEGRVIERGDQLRTSEARLLEAQAVAHIGSWEWDPAANRVWWSQELYRIYGVDEGTFEPTYDGFLALVHPEDRPALVKAVTDALEHGTPYEIEHRIRRPGGEGRTLSAKGRAVRDAGGRTIRLTGTGQDITERKQAEEERRQLMAEQAARREAEEASRLKDQFLAMISHELRTPLNAVLGWSRMLSLGTLTGEAAARALQTIERNAQAQARLINDLLDVSRFAASGIRLDLQVVDMVPVVSSVIEAVEPSAAARGIALTVSAGDTLEVAGDPQRLQQITWNLLSNAVKFTPDGGAIEVRLAGSESSVEMRVTDSGPGIDDAHLQRVFEPFWQADSSRVRTHGGLGLGLAIVRYLVDAHGGTVRVENVGNGRGASFTVTLPRRRA